ncbi:Dabb family protein [Micromonospora rifamycinica]|uniref:Stress responsive A/B Barrel Domain n=1 Tax=Micromonospora rifamycinica TaxID=291594 RepID=A0A120F8X1_9ACTN|nr:Dabb family protein [Micromonospora rifamycinica]KWV32526.1 stress responsive protein [Micromonospora rifamycinica]SCG81355.1 Stress responsive A/B Barrel Domain [Micromonospora rifamycinica]
MIYHGNRIKIRDDADPGLVAQALDALREQGRVIPAVTAFIVGREYGGDFDWGAVFVLEDLDGYWEYLNHPAHARSERLGIPLMARFEAYDITDDDSPDFAARVAALQKRHYETDPELLAAMPSDTGTSVHRTPDKP